jgi:hypothetical protein
MNTNSQMYGSCEARSSAAVPSKQIRPSWRAIAIAVLCEESRNSAGSFGSE